MIWESIPLMTLFDLVIFSLAAASLRIFLIHRGRLVESHMLLPTSLVVTGLFLIGIFYLSDLFVMWILPLFTGPAVSMAVMEDLHLNYSWFNILVVTLCIFAGFSLMMQQLLQHSTEVKLLNEDLRTELKERKQAEEALRNSQKLLLAIVDNSPSVIFLKDMEYRYILFNRSFELALNVKRNDILGKTDYDLYTKKEADRWRKTDQKAIKSGKPVEFMERVPHKDGMHHYLTIKFPLLDKEDKPYAVGGIATDVTQLKQSEEALNERLEFEALLSKISSEFINLPANEIDKEINSCLQLLGEFMGVDRSYIAEFSQGKSLISFKYEWTAASDIQPLLNKLQDVKTDSLPWLMERSLRGEGIVIPRVDDLPDDAANERATLQNAGVKSLVSVPLAVGGETLGEVGFNSVDERDWSDDQINQLKLAGEIFANALTRKRTDEALKESEERLKLATAATQLGTYDWHPLENKVLWDERMHEIFGLSERSRKDRNEYFFSILHPEDSERVVDTVQSFIDPKSNETNFKDEYRIVLKNKVKHIATQGFGFRNEKGEVNRVIGTCLDITERKETEKVLRKQRARLRESEERFRRLSEAAFEAIVISKDGNVIDANNQLAEMFGCRLDEIIGTNAMDFVAPESRDLVLQKIRSANEEPYEHLALRKDGTIFPVEVHGKAFPYQGRVVRVTAINDITKRKQAEEALGKTEEKYKSLFENMLNGFALHEMVFDEAGTPIDYIFLDVNKAFEKQTTLKRENLIGRKVTEVLPGIENDSADWIGTYGKVVLTGNSISFENYAEPLKKWYSVVAYRSNEGQFAVIFLDITERKQAEEALQKTTTQLRALAAHLQSVREEERTAIAREMHDELGQMLTALKIDLALIERELDRGESDVSKCQDEIKSMKHIIDTTIQTVRVLITELRPEVLDNLGLVAALEWQAEEFKARTGIACTFKSTIRRIDLSKKAATAVFRIFQEALTNIARHSKATHFDVNISKKNGNLFLRISDNGIGIPADKIENSKTFGLLGMQERAIILGGDVEINRVDGKGTTVTVKIPIN